MRETVRRLLARLDGPLPEGVTRKNIYSDIGRITAPAFVEQLLTQLTSMIDLMMVGVLGPWAITAVGLTSQPRFLLMAVFFALNTGATAMIARFKGAGDQRMANTVLRQGLMLTLLLSIAATALGVLVAEPLIRFMGMGAQEEIAIREGVAYFRIQMYAMALFALTGCVSASLRGVGVTRIVMLYNLAANVVKLIFNFLLIYGNLGFPSMGMEGAAWATNIGQSVAFLIAISVLATGARRNQFLYFYKGMSFKPDISLIRRITRIGGSAMLEQLLMRLGNMAFAITVASLGTLEYAAHTICFNIQSLSFMMGDAFSIASTSLMGQALGRKRPDIAQAVVRRSRNLATFCGFLLGVSILTFVRQFVGLYSDDPEVIRMGAAIVMIMACVMPFQNILSVLSGALRGAGDTRSVALVTLIGVAVMRPAISFLFVNGLGWGLMGAWYAVAMDQLTRSGLYYLRFRAGKWKKIVV